MNVTDNRHFARYIDRINQLHMQNYGEDDQQQASMVFGAK